MRLIVLCPTAMQTGGPEALHQLVDSARRQGCDAHIMYTFDRHAEVPESYRHYDVAPITFADDELGTAVVVPEAAPQLIPLGPTKTMWALWWLSVDNAFMPFGSTPGMPADDPPLMQHFCSRTSGVVHLAQSEYARSFLAERGTSSSMLTDYLSAGFLARREDTAETPKQDLVLFNPRKGVTVTRRLIQSLEGQFNFRPIEGLDAAGVAKLMASAKLYVDFGEHPGRDRLPREAAMSGCTIVTGVRGSAANDIDIPIDRRFKIEDDADDLISRFSHITSEIFSDFPRVSTEFDHYRRSISDQRTTFDTEVAMFLSRLENTLHHKRFQNATGRELSNARRSSRTKSSRR